MAEAAAVMAAVAREMISEEIIRSLSCFLPKRTI